MLVPAIILALVSRLISLGLYPLTDPSEGRYADIGRRIVQTGDWITPWIESGVPFWGKPPLSFWMTASSLQVLGETAFAARLPHFLAGLIVLWVVYDMFKRQQLPTVALYAVALTTGSVIFFISSGTVMTDAALMVGAALAMRGFWMAVNGDPKRRNLEYYIFSLGLAVGLLAKGPLILVISLGPIGLWVLYSRNLKFALFELPWLRGLALVALLTLPWYIAAELKTPGFIEYFIVGEHWQRYLQRDWDGDLYGKGHGKPLGMIWVFALAAMLPWTILLPILAWLTRKQTRQAVTSNDKSMLLYFGIWALFLLAFFSLSSNVLIAYTLPAVAPLACLAAVWLARRQAPKATMRTLIAGVVFTMALSLTAVAYINFSQDSEKFSTNTLIENWKQSATSNEDLYFYLWIPQSAKFYSSGQAKVFTDVDQIRQAVSNEEPIFIALYDTLLRTFPEDLREHLRDPQPFGRYTLFRIGN